MAKPILLISDDPSASSGLARITRDLATLLASMEEFRVGTLGLGGTGSARLPWPQYHMQPGEFGEITLAGVWDEFSRGEPGIVMTTWDATRTLWLARPELCELVDTREWLLSARVHKFKLHGYFPFDATGPGGRFTGLIRECLLGYDRILVPSPWARDQVVRTIGSEQAEARGTTWMPHALDGKVWKP